MSGAEPADAIAAAVDETARQYGTTSDLVFALPSQVRQRYEAHRALRRAVWDALVARGVVPMALSCDAARAFRTSCPCCRGRGSVMAYSEHHGAWLSSRGRSLRDPCSACCHTRRHYGTGWVENDFPLSVQAMAAVACRGRAILDAESAAREIARRAVGSAPPRTVWWADGLGCWPRDGRRSMLRAMAKARLPGAGPDRKVMPSRRHARALDAKGRREWAEAYGDQAPPSPFEFAVELRALGADLVDVSPLAATLFVALDDPGPWRSVRDD